ncbi:YgiW/YdeI family stress tolerance OB fold protein [Actinobacillus equuli subsp. equuli]|uniref:YgiW/YdeI family stress tolerance OB fold protein n=1 Tax=Actinobacillus equuli subsp. equuli TaxID=202947 RepID=A0A9X4G608_ACTEU|nr:NirD/YgiW/YdeI family stress tolerance protein [Actinobacillus equuli]MDE8035717.1 YgiW/YdeI family stress tolerance OB fold protein [Actinobacillus equuli subsp. equuli]MDG4949012.1 YgiW/YdeI family stress tolerance OB fold protein [Actinobacillus equuli subsp. haemolyticus]WGE85937.1 YgiW/YdeI family stress tolerance OB fold protein [Actinobacillus equuli subsp. haemolyticus]
MKKLTVLSTLAVATLLAACSQPTSQNQTFGENAVSVVTVAQAKSSYDDSRVTLEGKILRQVDNDEYIFADSTGDIKVEIDDHVWNGLNVTPSDKIRIQGKLDKETFNSSIDVYTVEKAQ